MFLLKPTYMVKLAMSRSLNVQFEHFLNHRFVGRLDVIDRDWWWNPPVWRCWLIGWMKRTPWPPWNRRRFAAKRRSRKVEKGWKDWEEIGWETTTKTLKGNKDVEIYTLPKTNQFKHPETLGLVQMSFYLVEVSHASPGSRKRNIPRFRFGGINSSKFSSFVARWWQLKYFLCLPWSLGRWSNLTVAYFSVGLVQPQEVVSQLWGGALVWWRLCQV